MENTVVFEWKIFLNGKYSSTTYIYKNFTKVKKKHIFNEKPHNPRYW